MAKASRQGTARARPAGPSPDALTRFATGLVLAQALYDRGRAGGDHGRLGAIAALNATVELIVAVPDWANAGLARPLGHLADALLDARIGARDPILDRAAVHSRPLAPRRVRALWAIAVVAFDLLRSSGMTRAEAARHVARAISTNSRQGAITSARVLEWRDRARAGEDAYLAERVANLARAIANAPGGAKDRAARLLAVVGRVP